ncbi:MAG: hypothetical protein NC548_38280 [Lachnospiraceae bacterium]|nr:hypothetical protein [Lachnospiraceae bacterium]MCM1231577.1 hypothetical protein [Ruminococcus flavefaciens]
MNKEYKYLKFCSCREYGSAGEQLAEFLNGNPDTEIVSVQFTNTETYNPNSHSYSKTEYAHLIYKD